MATVDARPVGGFKERFREWLVTGAALILPLLVSLVVISVLLNFVSGLLDPIVTMLGQQFGFVETDTSASVVLVKTVAVVVTVAAMLALGMVANRSPTGGRATQVFHNGLERIPGFGSIYTGFRQMSEVVVDSDVDSFQDVKLVEYPSEGSYTIAFVTAETPTNIEQATGTDDMVTLFMPMAPNPVMGGFVLHVSRDRVVDVDMTVEEGVRSIVTSGVTVSGENRQTVSPDRLQAMGIDTTAQQVDPDNGFEDDER
ncbi:DUF502 domain-containing protein [Halomarina oriensis]|uniref:DUF502 domain-containing protein n=1 Tax=Halomarina oriensis TaxID=671145 RepID=A0A6B0GMC5_9EURY|nr:DUF502 domain-containing protein [Halomarina oriensis]MWG36056.1 DUF502 domain-containing protein [Halomarina oriensis]